LTMRAIPERLGDVSCIGAIQIDITFIFIFAVCSLAWRRDRVQLSVICRDGAGGVAIICCGRSCTRPAALRVRWNEAQYTAQLSCPAHSLAAYSRLPLAAACLPPLPPPPPLLLLVMTVQAGAPHCRTAIRRCYNG